MYKSLKKLDEDNYRALAEAIIVQAVKDYRSVLKRLKYDYDCRNLISQKRSLENFFSSEWFSVLTKVNGKALARKIREEIENI